MDKRDVMLATIQNLGIDIEDQLEKAVAEYHRVEGSLRTATENEERLAPFFSQVSELEDGVAAAFQQIKKQRDFLQRQLFILQGRQDALRQVVKFLMTKKLAVGQQPVKERKELIKAQRESESDAANT